MTSTKDPVRQARWDERIAYIESRRNVPCADCGGTFPQICMDFHHIDPETKDRSGNKNYSMKHKMKEWGKKRIDEELDMCVVLCANCHRIRHDKEKML